MGLFGPPNLKKLEEEENIGGLIKALSYKDKDIRAKAADILGEIKAPAAIEALKKTLNDKEECVRKAAKQALTKTEEEIKRAKEEKRKQLEGQILQKLTGVSDDEKIKNVMELLKTPDLDTRVVTASQVAKLNIEAVGVWYELANTLADEHEEVRLSSAKAFWELKGVDYAIRSLRDEYNVPAHMSQQAALKGIHALKTTSEDTKAFDELIKNNWGECPTHEMELQRLIDAQGTRESNRIVLELVENSDQRVRVAVSSLALKLGLSDDNSNAWYHISKLLADDDEKVRIQTALSNWQREKEFVPSERTVFRPMTLTIQFLKTHFERGRLNKTQVVRAILSLIDSTPRNKIIDSINPLVERYVKLASWDEIFRWEELRSELAKRNYIIFPF